MYTKALALFPADDPTLGAPFNTGDSLFDRVAAWYTDIMFLTPRRSFFQRAAPLQKMFAYYFREFIPKGDRTLGGDYKRVALRFVPSANLFLVFHGAELPFLFGPVPPTEAALAQQMKDFYINFVHDLDPGGASLPFSALFELNIANCVRSMAGLLPCGNTTGHATNEQ